MLKTQHVLNKIKGHRLSKSYSQEYIAAKLKMSQNGYSKIELGYTKVTLIQFFKIAALLEIDYKELLKQESYFPTGEDSYDIF